jgi:hypothetical protein
VVPLQPGSKMLPTSKGLGRARCTVCHGSKPEV